MDGQKQPEASASTDEHVKQSRHPVMDISRPKTSVAQSSSTTEPTAEKPAEVTDVATPPPEDSTEKSDNPAATLEETQKKKLPKPPKPPKQPRQPGVSMAIFATMVIILGLGALATYAYLRTNNIALF
jgi:hypothetical protein